MCIIASVPSRKRQMPHMPLFPVAIIAPIIWGRLFDFTFDFIGSLLPLIVMSIYFGVK
jgi:hypothetical protein